MTKRRFRTEVVAGFAGLCIVVLGGTTVSALIAFDRAAHSAATREQQVPILQLLSNRFPELDHRMQAAIDTQRSSTIHAQLPVVFVGTGVSLGVGLALAVLLARWLHRRHVGGATASAPGSGL